MSITCKAAVIRNNKLAEPYKDSQPLSIEEVDIYGKKCLKMFDVLGRELNEAPVGTMYIRNNKKYIRVR